MGGGKGEGEYSNLVKSFAIFMESVNESFILTVGLCSPSLSGVEGSAVERLGVITMLNPNYAQEAKRTNALARILGLEIGFNPDLATLGFHQKGFYKTVKTPVLLSRCEAEKMLMHFLGKKISEKKHKKGKKHKKHTRRQIVGQQEGR
jgi:hypothetical protein